MSDGWIKLYRKTLDNVELMSDDSAFKAFMCLLMVVDRKTGEWSGGRFQLSRITYMNDSKTYRAIKKLKKLQMCTLMANTKYTTIRICNWSNYQDITNTKGEQQSNSERTAIEHSNKKKELRIKNNSNVESHSRYQPIHEKICNLFSKNINLYKLTDKRKKILAIRLKDTGEENIIKACDALSKSLFHMGDNARNWIADPYWCLQSVEKAEEWSNKYESSGYKGNLTELEF